jgi:hypothetical protein
MNLMGISCQKSPLELQDPFLTSNFSQVELGASFFFNFIIHMCIQGLGHFSPCPHPLPYYPLHPLPLFPTPSIPSRNYFALISNFVVERV